MSKTFPSVKDLNLAAKTWRRNAVWGTAGGFVVGLLVGAGLCSQAAERPPERLTLAKPAPTVTASPLPPVRAVRVLPDGNSELTLADGRTITAAPAGGPVYVNGTLQPDPNELGPTTIPDPDGAGHVLYWQSCRQADMAGMAPISDDEPGYRPGLDPDHDGVACNE